MNEELRFHIEQQTAANIAAGMSPVEARRQAALKLGAVEGVKENCREERRGFWLESLWADVRYGARMLCKSPGFTTVAVLTLALGIGSTTAIFSVVDAVLLQSTPYQNPSQLVVIQAKDAQGGESSISASEFEDWRDSSQVFQSMAAYESWEFHTLTEAGEPDEVWTSPVSPNLFRLLGVNVSLGRVFGDNESREVILSNDYWRSHLAADPRVVGKILALDGQPYTIVGVAPANFEFMTPNCQMWMPLSLKAVEKKDRAQRSLNVVARLKPGVSVAQAQAEMNVVAQREAAASPKNETGWSVRVQPLQFVEAGEELRSAILVLVGAAAFVLLIVCSNVAGMLLARGAARQGEMAVRSALGATRSRLIRQLVVESVILTGAAGIAGVALARWGLAIVVNLVPKFSLIETQSLHQIAINHAVLGFALALSLLTGIVVGLLPALRISRLSIHDSLKGIARTAAGLERSVLPRILIVAEVALALVLLVGAGLMIQSFEFLEAAPIGFNPDRVLTVRVPLVNYKYAQGPPSADFYREILERIRAIPGVDSAGMANNLPFTGFHTSVYLDGPTPAGADGGIQVTARSVSPGFFQVMGIPLKEGREFTSADAEKSARCVRIINEAMARRYWPGQDPVGKLVYGACEDGGALIVGLVGDSKQSSVDSPAEPEIYAPYAQHPFASFLVTFVVRTRSNPLELAAAVRDSVWTVDRNQPVIQVRTMESVISESIWRQHFAAFMLEIFAAIAVVLSSIGIYGLLSYSVGRRMREFGIRVALGARSSDVLRLVIGEGLLLAVVGVAIGIAGAFGLTRFLASMLYGVSSVDPATFVAVPFVLVAVALAACYIPARRAMRVDPMVALRYE